MPDLSNPTSSEFPPGNGQIGDGEEETPNQRERLEHGNHRNPPSLFGARSNKAPTRCRDSIDDCPQGDDEAHQSEDSKADEEGWDDHRWLDHGLPIRH